MLRGDVYEASLDPVEGSEQAGFRPVLIVSRDAINKNSPVVIAIPLTGLEHCPHIYPSQVLIRGGVGGLAKDSVALGEQVRAISKKRLCRHMGHIPPGLMTQVSVALKIALDLP
jgi:mRNA interferase MazF